LIYAVVTSITLVNGVNMLGYIGLGIVDVIYVTESEAEAS